jgi:hypothetical protein
MHRRKVAARRGVLIVQIIDCRKLALSVRLFRVDERYGDVSPATACVVFIAFRTWAVLLAPCLPRIV